MSRVSALARRAAVPSASPREQATPMVWVDGRVVPADRPALTVADRGFQLGDGVFETLRFVDGKVVELSLHAERLVASAHALAIPLPNRLETVLDQGIRRVCAANHLQSAAVRVTVSRGPVHGRVALPPPRVEPTIVIQAWPVEPPRSELLERGLHLAVSTVRRDPLSPLAKVKTTSRAEFVFARLEAQSQGCDDAVFCTTDGHLAEATSASLFLVIGDRFVTPSLDCGILASTTRQWVIDVGACSVGMSVQETKLTVADLHAADEAFLASAVAGIMPVTRIGDRPIGSERPGELTMRLRRLREGSSSPAARAVS